MPENNIGYFLIFFCFVGGVVSTIVGLANNRVNLGVDLRGGSILVYTVSPAGDSERDTVTNDEMGLLKNAIMKRINPSGVREISIQELGANTEIKITIPEADDVEVARLERVITGAGNLQFRILASLSSSDADVTVSTSIVAIDWASQRIFETPEEVAAFKAQIAADAAQREKEND